MRKAFAFIGIFFALLSVAVSVSAQSFYVDGDYVADRRGYDSAVSYTHDFQPYTTSFSSYTPFRVNTFFQDTYYKLPYTQTKQDFSNNFDNDLTQQYAFDQNRDYAQNYQDIQQQNTLTNANARTGYSYTNARDATAFGQFAGGNSYALDKEPCQSRSIHYNPSGKKRDVHFTETICDGVSVHQSDANAYNYGYSDTIRFDNTDFGNANFAYNDAYSRTFMDTLRDAFSGSNSGSGKLSETSSGSQSGSYRFFDWLYN